MLFMACLDERPSRSCWSRTMGRSTSASFYVRPLPLGHTTRSNGCQNTPELNDIEVVWHDLKAYQLAQKTFTEVAELDGAIHNAVEDLNRERMVVPLAKPPNLCLAFTPLRGVGVQPSSAGFTLAAGNS
jgi:hypothetical protein